MDATRVDTDAGPLWFPSADAVILPFLARTGRWEPDEGDLLLSLARPGCRFLDVGANVGYFSALVAKAAPGAQITAVEPEPTSLAFLRLNLWALAPSARIFGLALSAGDRIVALERAVANPGDTRVRAGVDRATLLAPAAPGDELFVDDVFDLVKIDVQGGELDVISGMLSTLRRSAGVTLVVEFFPSAIRSTRRSPETVLARYRELGFDVLTQVAGRLRRCDDAEILQTCASGGEEGYVNLVLRLADQAPAP
jgi:FkbM family methyltransferase